MRPNLESAFEQFIRLKGKPLCERFFLLKLLEKNRKYVVIDVKDNEQKCPIHSGGVVIPVEIDRAKIDLLTDSKSIFEGSTFTYNAPDCDEKCDDHDLCFPDGLVENDKCIVLENNGKHHGECKKGRKLNKLTLGFVI